MDNRAQVSFEYLIILAFLCVMVLFVLLLTPSLFSMKDSMKSTNDAYINESLGMVR